MPKRRIAKGNARSLAQKRAQQKAAEASARARRKRGGDEPSARRAVARLDTNSPNNKRDIVALKDAVKGGTARGKLSLAASAKVGRENVINDADRIAYRASAAESRRLKVKLGDNAPTADKIFSTAKKIAKIRAGGDEVKTADIKKASLSLDPDEKTPDVAKKVPLKDRSIVGEDPDRIARRDAARAEKAKMQADDDAKREARKSDPDLISGRERRNAIGRGEAKPRKLTDSQIIRSGSQYKDLDDATIKQSIQNLVDKKSSKPFGQAGGLTSGEEDQLKGLRAEQRRRKNMSAQEKMVDPQNVARANKRVADKAAGREHRNAIGRGEAKPRGVVVKVNGVDLTPAQKKAYDKEIADSAVSGRGNEADLVDRARSKNGAVRKALMAEVARRSESRSNTEGERRKLAAQGKAQEAARKAAEGGAKKPDSGKPGVKSPATPKSMTDARLRDEIKKAKPNSPELYDLQEELGDRDSASPQERRNAKAAMQAKSDLKRESRQSDPDLISSRNSKAKRELQEIESNRVRSVRQGPVKKAAPKARDGLAKALADGKAGVEIKATEIQEGDVIDLIHEVQSITKNKDTGLFEVKTKTFGKDASYVSNSVKRLYSDETVILNAEDKKKSPEAKKAPAKARTDSSRSKALDGTGRSGRSAEQEEAKRELQKVESNRVRSVISSLGGSTARVSPMDDESDYTYTSDGKVQHKEGGFVVVLNDKPDLVSLRAKLENNGFEVSIDEPNSAHPKIVIVPKDDKDKK